MSIIKYQVVVADAMDWVRIVMAEYEDLHEARFAAAHFYDAKDIVGAILNVAGEDNLLAYDCEYGVRVYSVHDGGMYDIDSDDGVDVYAVTEGAALDLCAAELRARGDHDLAANFEQARPHPLRLVNGEQWRRDSLIAEGNRLGNPALH